MDKKRAERFPQTKAEEAIPERTPKTEARRLSGTLSA